jgi:adenylate kinase
VARYEEGDSVMRIVFLGPPGAGKGTHATRCARAWHVVHISTGDLFRAEAKQQSPLGQELATYMQQGALVPDALVIRLVQQRLSAADAKQGFILDGFPRTLAQAQALDAALQGSERLQMAIHFETSEAVIVRRLAGRRICRSCSANYHVDNLRPKVAGVCDLCQGNLYQRDDDSSDTVMRRLQVHAADAEPLLAYYRTQGILRDVDGDTELEALQPILTQLVANAGLLAEIRG